jgi:hypothetical protein
MMKAFVDSNMGAVTSGVEFYKRIVDLLDLGRRTWPNVSREASIFLKCPTIPSTDSNPRIVAQFLNQASYEEFVGCTSRLL